MTSDDQQLIERFRGGETAAFDTLYSTYGTRIYRFCHRLSGSVSDAEDLTQEVFLAAYRGREKFSGKSSLATWLYRIAINRRHAGRRDQRLVTKPFNEENLKEPQSPDPAIAGIERMQLERALAALPEHLREAFLLVKAEGLLCREAAQALGIPEGTVKFHVHQAVIQLRRLLSESDSTVTGGLPKAQEALHEM